MRIPHQFTEDEFGKENLQIFQEWKHLEMNISNNRNHHGLTIMCLGQDIIPVSVKLKTTMNTIITRQINHETERKFLQEHVRTINNMTDCCALRHLARG